MKDLMLMKEFTQNDFKKVSLEILDYFHNFCVEHKLKYSLFYGSLLGAVRHNGFIPWDDDVDVVMPREDYEVLISIFGNQNFEVKTCFNCDIYPLTFAKICNKNTLKIENVDKIDKFIFGFCIDVFPIDYIDSYDSYKLKKRKINKYIRKRKYSMANRQTGNFAKRFLKTIVKIPFKHKANKYCQIIDKMSYDTDKKSYLCCFDIDYPKDDYIFNSDIFDNLVLHKFEGKDYFITTKYDECLTTLYGDYMTLPPLEKRITHHSFKAYFRD